MWDADDGAYVGRCEMTEKVETFSDQTWMDHKMTSDHSTMTTISRRKVEMFP